MEFSDNPSPMNVEALLSAPTEENASIERKSCQVSANQEKYKLKDKNFLRQYAHIYSERLLTMRPSLVAAAKKKWGNNLEFVINVNLVDT